MRTGAPSTEDRRAIHLFDDLDDARLASWLAAAEALHAAPGDVLAEQGELSPGLLLVLEGSWSSAIARSRSAATTLPRGLGRSRRSPKGPSACACRP